MENHKDEIQNIGGRTPNILEVLCWWIVIGCSVYGIFEGSNIMADASGVLHQIAGMLYALSFTLIPYCIVQTIWNIFKKPRI
ncbi:MAG: hypothetical protein ACR2N8_00300 [Parvibaculales bacterium]